MTVTANDLLVGPVVPAAAVTLISIDFYFENATDLEVYKSGSNTPLTLDVDYTVSLPTAVNATDGSITLAVAANGTDTYAIYGKQPLTRTSDLQLRGDFRSPVINLELDRLWRAVQGLNTALARTFQFSQASTIPEALETLTDASRQNQLIGFSADGSALELIVSPEGLATLAGLTDEIIALGGLEAELEALYLIRADIEAVSAITAEIVAAEANATAAAASASAASTSETNAATSETNAAASETAAAASETAAAASETAAGASETAAAASETAAGASETAAAASAAAAATSYDTFDDRYLGAKATDPTVDNDGDPLITGAQYFNTAANEIRVYDGADWASTAPEAFTFGGFRATMGSGQSIAAATSATLIFGTEEFDTEGGYDPSTGIFTVPASLDGQYMAFFAGAKLTSTSGGTLINIQRDTGSGFSEVAVSGADSGAVQGSENATTGPLLLSTGDQFRVTNINLSAETVDVSGASYFSGASAFTATAPVASTPAGTVITVAMNTAPSGYLKADGSAVSRTTYAALFAAIGTTFGAGDGSTTFDLPDLRGEFVRGWDDGRGVDSGRTFGSAQSDDLKAHTHTLPQFSNATGAGTNNVEATNDLGVAKNTGSTGGSETRPRNIALLYCIKT